jgi:peptidoglycan hydrolase-like protein with peptidoglycan-binding domain
MRRRSRPPRGGRRLVSATAGGLLLATTAACASSNPGAGETAAERDRQTTATVASSTIATEATTTAPLPSTTTTAPAPPPPPPPPPPPDAAADGMLRPGEGGPAVLALQQRLSELGYWMGSPDAGYGELTRQAVLAFQKAEGLGRDGVAGPETQGRLAAAGRPGARSTAGNHIEIDIGRQLLLVVQNGQVQWAFNIATGASGTPTPRGEYGLERQIDGYRRSELGLLYRPKYFVGGIAIHGHTSVPAYPASHGCTRVSNPAMDLLWSSGVAQIGTPVWVY